MKKEGREEKKKKGEEEVPFWPFAKFFQTREKKRDRGAPFIIFLSS